MQVFRFLDQALQAFKRKNARSRLRMEKVIGGSNGFSMACGS
jgi:hypothetical protein